MMNKRLFIMASVVLLAGWGAAMAAERAYLPLGWPALLEIHRDWAFAHEGQPDGVPPDYDWAQTPRMGAGNEPDGFNAFTGWGQVFATAGNPAPLLAVSIRNMQVLVCHGPQRNWTLLQQGDIDGSQFRPDYEGNLNKPPVSVRHKAGIASVNFEKGHVYHFWPSQGRVELPDQKLCGIVVLLQARTSLSSSQTASRSAGILLGLGADYWRDMQASWDNYHSNQDAAIGRLRWVDATWRWFGMSTASLEDLRRLYVGGYSIATPQAQ